MYDKTRLIVTERETQHVLQSVMWLLMLAVFTIQVLSNMIITRGKKIKTEKGHSV